MRSRPEVSPDSLPRELRLCSTAIAGLAVHSSSLIRMLHAAEPYVRAALVGLAASAVVVAHGFTHELTLGPLSSRPALLGETAPFLWMLLVALALGTLVVGFALLVLRQLRMASPILDAGKLYPRTALRLAGFQVAAFVGLEAVEMWLEGGSLMALPSEPIVVIGLMLQLLAASAGAALFVIFAKTLEHLNKRITRRQADCAGAGFSPILAFLLPRFEMASGGPTLRGPPPRC